MTGRELMPQDWWAISTAMVASFILIAHLIVWLLEAWWSRLVYLLEAQS